MFGCYRRAWNHGHASRIDIAALPASERGLNTRRGVDADDGAVVSSAGWIETARIYCGWIANNDLSVCVHGDAHWVNQQPAFGHNSLIPGMRIHVNHPAGEAIIDIGVDDIGDINIIALNGDGARRVKILTAGNDFLAAILGINTNDLAGERYVGHKQLAIISHSHA